MGSPATMAAASSRMRQESACGHPEGKHTSEGGPMRPSHSRTNRTRFSTIWWVVPAWTRLSNRGAQAPEPFGWSPGNSGAECSQSFLRHCRSTCKFLRCPLEAGRGVGYPGSLAGGSPSCLWYPTGVGHQRHLLRSFYVETIHFVCVHVKPPTFKMWNRNWNFVH